MTNTEALSILESFGSKPTEASLFDDGDSVLSTKFVDTGNKEVNQQLLIHWWMNLYIPNESKVGHSIYRTWDNALFHNFKFVKPAMGYWTKTNQKAVSISAYKKEPVGEHIKEFNLWLPYIKPHKEPYINPYNKEEKLVKKIDIFEASLSQWGGYNLNYYSPTEMGIEHNRNVSTIFSNIQDCMTFICQRLYYKKRLS